MIERVREAKPRQQASIVIAGRFEETDKNAHSACLLWELWRDSCVIPSSRSTVNRNPEWNTNWRAKCTHALCSVTRTCHRLTVALTAGDQHYLGPLGSERNRVVAVASSC